MEIEERVKVCRLLEAVIAADGVVLPEEREFLEQVVRRFRLGDEDRGDAIPASDVGRATAMLRELHPDVRARVMALLVDAAVVDGHVDPHERAMLLAASATLGIEATALEERIAQRLKATSQSS